MLTAIRRASSFVSILAWRASVGRAQAFRYNAFEAQRTSRPYKSATAEAGRFPRNPRPKPHIV